MAELSPDTSLSHYRIVSRIGVGGMGEVYLAQDTKLDRKVALKILRRDWLGFAVGWAILAVFIFLLGRTPSVIGFIITAIVIGLFMIAPLWRYGLLTFVVMFLFTGFDQLPITTNFTAWYATNFVVFLALLVALAVYGFYTSLAGQKPFGGKFLEE